MTEMQLETIAVYAFGFWFMAVLGVAAFAIDRIGDAMKLKAETDRWRYLDEKRERERQQLDRERAWREAR